MKRGVLLLLSFLMLFTSNSVFSQKLPIEPFRSIADTLQLYFKPKSFVVGKLTVDSAILVNNNFKLYFSSPLSEYSFRNDVVNDVYAIVKKMIPSVYLYNSISIYTNGSLIEDYIPPFYNENLKSIPQKKVKKSKRKPKAEPLFNNFVINESRPFSIGKGLQNRHLAIWQSHGFYYEQKLLRWEWQRARIFQTVEDLYTQSYVLPFLLPMLENAGATVMLPRERDVQVNEVIIDNDNQYSGYSEMNGEKSWCISNTPGFAHTKDSYISGENPFSMGSARVVKADHKGSYSTANWSPKIPQAGEYAVYISYQSFPNSSKEARYTVSHMGGTTKFKVNQQVGGGTWIYLGTFKFDKGENHNQYVSLSNYSTKKGDIICADAVKFGGGMGNIARNPAPEGSEMNRPSSSAEQIKTIKIPIDVKPTISGYPRYTEGARYWLQWAGYSDTIYSANKNANDYNDDYMSRGKWVNVLSGGSRINKEESGLKIPIDMAFAFHTDAGTTLDNSIIGTLGIYTKLSNGTDKFPNGEPRFKSRFLTDLIQSQIVEDIRKQYEPEWQRRGIWDRSYSESRSPKVPTMLLELLSHQNFADMRYGLDPNFRFTVSRAIYKGMLKYLSLSNGLEYVVQPLPVNKFAITLNGNTANLLWRAVTDTLEKSAVAKQYVVYKRIDNQGFDNGVIVDNNSYSTEIEKGKIYSFKVTALNEGGESFPSEILSVYKAAEEKGQVLIVNCFDRVSAPYSFATKDTSMAGFSDFIDHGVPYLKDISYIGSQYEYRREIPWMDDDSPGFGSSYGDYETKVIAGNTFDYPYIHGKAFSKIGYSFVSSSKEAVTDSLIDLNQYKIVDFIIGKQCQTKIGRGASPIRYKIFDNKLQNSIKSYCLNGGNILLSGSYIASDIWDSYLMDEESKKFAMNVLKYKWRTHFASKTGEVKGAQSPYPFDGKFSFYTAPNQESYCVEAPDALEPTDSNAWTIFRYADNNISAGVAYSGTYKSVVLGFPIETLKSEEQIDRIINMVVNFFNKR